MMLYWRTAITCLLFSFVLCTTPSSVQAKHTQEQQVLQNCARKGGKAFTAWILRFRQKPNAHLLSERQMAKRLAHEQKKDAILACDCVAEKLPEQGSRCAAEWVETDLGYKMNVYISKQAA